MKPFSVPFFATTCMALATVASPVRSQCATTWQAGDAVPGASDFVTAVALHDPDGPGPAPPILLVGGKFEVAGDAVVHGLAAYDPGTGRWSQFAGDVEGPGGIYDLLSLPNGELVAAGAFHTIGGVLAFNVARYDGTAWHQLGPNQTTGHVSALARLANGDIVAAGTFQTIGGVVASRVARWDGSQWHAIGAGFAAEVHDLTVRANGTLVAVGEFPGGVAEWNGATWTAPMPGLFGSIQRVYSVLEAPGGDLVIGGDFALAGGTAVNIARFDGFGWSVLGTGLQGTVLDLALLPTNEICAVGRFGYPIPGSISRVARWNGSSWSGFGFGYESDTILTGVAVAPNGDLFVGGWFTAAGGIEAQNLAHYGGGAWSALGSGTIADVDVLVADGDDLIAGGSFAAIGGVAAANIARLHNGSWSSLGGGVDGPVHVVAKLPNGDLVVGGSFANAGSTPAPGLARHDGSGWQAIPGPGSVAVRAIAVLDSGDLIVGGFGSPTLYLYSGGISTPIPGAWAEVSALAILPNGDLLASGRLIGPNAPYEIQRWNGTTWTSLGAITGGPGLRYVSDFVVLANGDIVAGGRFRTVGGVTADNIARWDGVTWHPLGLGLSEAVSDLQLLGNGDLLAIGDFEFADGAPAAHVARWDGVAWHAVDGGLGDPGQVLTVTRSGSVYAGGGFVTAGGLVAAHVAELRPSCPTAELALAPACP
ncbi:MAG: delta-60 repeat domain-containing protein, partial [Planctomycetes bacterium]|nr:delta-60 repeat domain-containing protein [Planctomycetota bacterium]